MASICTIGASQANSAVRDQRGSHPLSLKRPLSATVENRASGESKPNFHPGTLFQRTLNPAVG